MEVGLLLGHLLASDGKTANLADAGEFRVYEFDGNNWNPLGQQIIGTPGDRLEESVVISGDAVSSPQSDENCSNAGKVVVYQYSDVEGGGAIAISLGSQWSARCCWSTTR